MYVRTFPGHLRSPIPAVKITGADSNNVFPLSTIESVCDDILSGIPESCMSAGSASASPSSSKASSVTTDESDEDSDLGEFLLDAVQWL